MRVEGKIVVITGSGYGIGKGLAERFVTEGAKAVVISDINEELMASVAETLGMPAIACNVADPAALANLIEQTEREIGPIDLFCSNAAYGFGGPVPNTTGNQGGLDATEDDWERSWQINVMAHIRAARQLIPLMLERGGGYFLNTVSAAGLITSISGAPYTVTKHADIGWAEWIMLNYGDQGIGVSCLCPTAIATKPGQFDGNETIGLVQTPAEVAQYVVDGLDEERFLILPNPAVGGSFLKKATDYDAWLARTIARIGAMKGE
ncbi:MAG: SDR family oxidoreductase [Acidobacteria bacterium]|nr:SDR family oxidoreductase [Acidobacteriota bacterium]